MRVLTDTHTLVWALNSPNLLSKKAKKALNDSEVIVSVVNLWELILKSKSPNALLSDPLKWWHNYVVKSGLTTLSIQTAHVRALDTLAALHKDPFDRILIAQSLAENLTLITKDAQLVRYGISVIW